MTSSASISAPFPLEHHLRRFAPRWTSCASSREKRPRDCWTSCRSCPPRRTSRGLCRNGLPARTSTCGCPGPSGLQPQLSALLRPTVGLGVLARAAGARGARDHRRDAPNSARIGRSHGEEFSLGRSERANFEAHDQGAETAILLDLAGFVTEGPGFNVFTVIDSVAASPARGALEGITRLSVFELCEALGIPTQTRPISRAEIEGADGIFFSTTAGGIMPVSRLGSRILGNDRPGPISSRLRKAYWDKRREGWQATRIDYD